jgi:uncharacterized protein
VIGKINNYIGLLIIFTRYPEPGQVKTRLIPALGQGGAAEMQRHMIRQTLKMAEDLSENYHVDVEVHFTGGDSGKMQQMFGDAFPYCPQSNGDLGARMLNSFRQAFRLGWPKVIIIGTDCPGISADLMERAFNGLEEDDLVLGPALDGGYYLIGLRRATPALFKGIPWGTDEVLTKTKVIAEELKISVMLMEPLADIDRPEDLKFWECLDI